MTTWKFVLRLATILFLSPYSAQADGAKLVIQLDKASYVIGEPIMLRCVFRNTSNEPTEVDMGGNQVCNISFEINPGTPDSSIRPYAIHRGGGSIPGYFTLQPQQSTSRYVVLDQWFRATEPGMVSLRLILRFKGQTISDSFKLKIDKGNDKDLESAATAAAEKFFSLQKKKGEADVHEVFSYRYALATYFSYLDPGRTANWEEDVKKRYDGNSFIFEIIRRGRTMGPGGSRLLD